MIRLRLLLSVVCLLLLTGCPPAQPCDTEIKDPDSYRDLALANPELQQVLAELKLQDVDVYRCIIDRQVSILMRIEIPPAYSAYQITYMDYISLSYHEDNTLWFVNDGVEPSEVNQETIREHFQQKIAQLEQNRRVQEVIQKTQPDPQNNASPLMNGRVIAFGGRKCDNSCTEEVQR